MIRVLKNVFFVLWNIAIIVFSTTIILEDYLKDDLNVKTGNVIGMIIFLGVVFFILFLLFYELSIKGHKPKLYWQSKLYLKEMWYIMIPASLLLISIFAFINKPDIQTNKQEVTALQRQIEQMNREKLSDTQPSIDTQPPSNNKPQVVETDPMVNCQISQNCGGGTKYLKKSDCDNSVCCEIGDEWFFYFSKDECNKDQKSFTDELIKQLREDMENYDYDTPTYTPPVYDPPTTYTPPVYTPPQKTEEQIALEIEQCKSDVREKYSQLLSQCNFGDNSATEACIQTFTERRERELKACEY
jgi:hypothetical protein